MGWYPESRVTLAGNVLSTQVIERGIDSTSPRRHALPVGDRYMRLSSKALTSATSTELGIVANLTYV